MASCDQDGAALTCFIGLTVDHDCRLYARCDDTTSCQTMFQGLPKPICSNSPTPDSSVLLYELNHEKPLLP